jgi:hypothetical protein
MSGRAVLTIRASSATTKNPSIPTTNAARWAGLDAGMAAGAVMAAWRVSGTGTSIGEMVWRS